VLFRLTGLLILAPAGLALVFPDQGHMALGFLWPGLSLTFIGTTLCLVFRPQQKNVLSIAEGSAIVVVAWGVAIIAGAVPFLWAGLDLTRAIFEATSGWTTTGLSVVDVSEISPLLLFFRSLMQLAGGAGLAILMLSTLAGPAGVGLSTAEGRTEQLVPQVRQSARLVLKLYGVYILFGVAALRLAGLDWFDAVNHTFCAVSTGGFSTRIDSIGYWNNPAVEAVLIVLMLLGAMNFLTVYTLWRGHWRPVVHNGEVRVMALLLPVATILLFLGVTFQLYEETPGQIRAAIFQAVTALSTTGYATVTFSDWNGLGQIIIIILMLVGGGTGSTAGGIKQHRIYLLAKGVKKELFKVFLSPQTIQEEVLWVGSHRRFLLESDLRKTGLYIALYLFTWLAGGCALTAFGHPPAASLFEFASALGTVGLSVGITGAATAAGQLWVEIAGMLLGRLEFFVIFWGIIKLGKDLSSVLPRGNVLD
jgi:trk system potassium uptake protein TrkH